MSLRFRSNFPTPRRPPRFAHRCSGCSLWRRTPGERFSVTGVQEQWNRGRSFRQDRCGAHRKLALEEITSETENQLRTINRRVQQIGVDLGDVFRLIVAYPVVEVKQRKYQSQGGVLWTLPR
jgi:hypothetical protein